MPRHQVGPSSKQKGAPAKAPWKKSGYSRRGAADIRASKDHIRNYTAGTLDDHTTPSGDHITGMMITPLHRVITSLGYG